MSVNKCKYIFVSGNALYVPKPIGNIELKNVWRHSFSVKEKNEVSSLDINNGCNRKCIRIVKAIFKHRTDGLFKCFTSYCIKTVAFYMKEKGMSWHHHHDLGKCVIDFLQEVQRCLEKAELMHKFEPSINLLEKIPPERMTQMANTLKKWLKSESTFYNVIKV